MEQIAVTRSIVSANALAEVVAAEYPLEGPVGCKLISKMLRTQDNDHYLVRAGGEKYVARLYQQGTHLNRQESDYLYELAWLNYLEQNQMPVSYAIPRQDGGYLGTVLAPEGERYFALFTYARGKSMSPNNDDQLFALGRKMAEIHQVSNGFNSSYQRQPMDLDYLIDRPVERLMRFWANWEDEKLDILLASAAEARAQIQLLLQNEQTTENSWGPIGGDFHPYNTHIDENGEPVFFNFDLCGYGWRAYDIAVFLLNAGLMKGSEALTEAFFAGYYAARPLSHNEHEAIAPFLTMRRVWLTGKFSMVDGIAGYTFIASAQLDA